MVELNAEYVLGGSIPRPVAVILLITESVGGFKTAEAVIRENPINEINPRAVLVIIFIIRPPYWQMHVCCHTSIGIKKTDRGNKFYLGLLYG